MLSFEDDPCRIFNGTFSFLVDACMKMLRTYSGDSNIPPGKCPIAAVTFSWLKVGGLIRITAIVLNSRADTMLKICRTITIF